MSWKCTISPVMTKTFNISTNNPGIHANRPPSRKSVFDISGQLDIHRNSPSYQKCTHTHHGTAYKNGHNLESTLAHEKKSNLFLAK